MTPSTQSPCEGELIARLRAYRPTNEWGDPVHHMIVDEAADTIERLTERVARMEEERDEARELLDKTRRKSSRDGMGGKVGELLDNQAWIVLSHVASQLSDHFAEPDLMEQWQEAYADGEVQKGYFTPHRGVAAWISRQVRARTPARLSRQDPKEGGSEETTAVPASVPTAQDHKPPATGEIGP